MDVILAATTDKKRPERARPKIFSGDFSCTPPRARVALAVETCANFVGMRVIAGEAKGHRLKTPATGTRPMTDRMREALFSALGDLNGYHVLDLYAGSGSLGIEAISRGAKHATFVENARDAIVRLEQNLEATGLKDRSEVLWSDVGQVLRRPATERLDLIFMDPPYGMNAASVQADLEALVLGGFLGDNGRILLHRPAKESQLHPLGLDLAWERDYGQACLYIFTHEEEAQE